MASSSDHERRLRRELKRKIEIVEKSPARPSESLIQQKLKFHGDKCFECNNVIQQARYEFVNLMANKEDLLNRRGGPLHFSVKMQQLYNRHDHKKKEILASMDNFVLAHEWYEILVAADEVEELTRLDFLRKLSDEVYYEPTEPGETGYPNPVEVHRDYDRRSVTAMVQHHLIAFDTLLHEEQVAVGQAKAQAQAVAAHEERLLSDLHRTVEQLHEEVHGRMDQMKEQLEQMKGRVEAMEGSFARRSARILESINNKHSVTLYKLEEHFKKAEERERKPRNASSREAGRKEEQKEEGRNQREEYEKHLKYYKGELEKLEDYIEKNAVRERHFGARMMRQREGLMRCVYCTEAGNHYSDACPRVRTVAERKLLLDSQKRCQLCLEQHEGDCKEEVDCFYCRNSRSHGQGKPKHHASICPKPEEFAVALKRRRAVRENLEHYRKLLEGMDARPGPSSAGDTSSMPRGSRRDKDWSTSSARQGH